MKKVFILLHSQITKYSSVGLEHCLDKAGVVGSNPTTST